MFERITRGFAKATHILNKNAPTILTYTGVAGGAAAGFLAARAAYKHGRVVTMGYSKASSDLGEMIDSGALTTKQETVGAMVFMYTAPTKMALRTYGPAVALGAVSIVCILRGHGIMRARNAALVTAYAALDRSFAAYRARVREGLENGEQVDGIWAQGLERDEDEAGNELVVRNDKAAHLYTRIFDDTNQNWGAERDYNLYWLKLQEKIFNDRLQSKGHVFLNEVLDGLGYEHTTEGAITGWILESEEGDGFIDFGLDKLNNNNKAFHISLEGNLLLEFNVDGVIHDKI